MSQEHNSSLQDQVTDGLRPRDRFDAVVEINRPLCREHFLLRLRVTGPREFPATKPGQFVQVGCRAPHHAIDTDALLGREVTWQEGKWPKLGQPEFCHPLALLRRPFSLAGRGDDARGTWIDVIHRVVGVGTDWLSHLKVGDAVDLIGPLGNAFTMPSGKSIGLLVGGGVGLPPMIYLARELRRSGCDAVAFIGAMSRDLLAVTLRDDVRASVTGEPAMCVEEFASQGVGAVVTTDDGSLGLKGRITGGLEKYLQAHAGTQGSRMVVYTCGPDRMMHAVATLAEKFGVECQVCVEQAMACGMGTCQSCVVKIEDRVKPQAQTTEGRPWRYRLACTDGPVFASKDVVW